MPQIVFHLTAQPTAELRAKALDSQDFKVLRPLLAGWWQYLPTNGNIAATRRKQAAAEAEAAQFGLALETAAPADLPSWAEEQGYLPNTLRDTEQGFCTTRAASPSGGTVTGPDTTNEHQYPWKFVARDRDGTVFGEGHTNHPGIQRALDVFATLGATHLDLYKRGTTDVVDTLRWMAPTQPAPGRTT